MFRNTFFKSLTVFAVMVLLFSQFGLAEAAKLDFGGHLDDNFWTVDTLYCKDGISITAQQTWLSDNPAPAPDPSPDFWLELGSSSIPVTVTPGVDPSARIGYGDGTSLVNGGAPFTVQFFFTALQSPGTPITAEIWRWDHGVQSTVETGLEDDNTHFDDVMTDTAVVGDCFIDTTPPTTSITQNPPANTNSDSATFAFTGTDNGTPPENLTYLCWLDNGPWQSCVSPATFPGLPTGVHQIWITASDMSGNYDPNYAYYTWTVDTAAPDTSIDSTTPSVTPTNSSTLDVNFSSPDATASFECSLDAAPFAACASPQHLTGLIDGSHTFDVHAKDPAGNVDASPASYAWTVDTSAPSVLTVNRANLNPTSKQSVSFTVAFSEPVTSVEVTDFILIQTGTITGMTVTSVTGSGAVYTVAINTGNGNGTLRLDLLNDGTITDLTGNPLSAGFASGQVYTLQKVLTFSSQAANDGWVLESGEKTNKGGTKNSTAATFNLGDDANNKQYRGILHFDTSLPSGAVVTSATLKIRKMGQVGTKINLFTKFGGLLVDTKMPGFGTPALAVGDFQKPGAMNIAKFGSTPVSNWYSVTIGSAYINMTGATQFRLRFKLDDNNDFLANYMKFYSGSAGANSPQLIIEYYVP